MKDPFLYVVHRVTILVLGASHHIIRKQIEFQSVQLITFVWIQMAAPVTTEWMAKWNCDLNGLVCKPTTKYTPWRLMFQMRWTPAHTTDPLAVYNCQHTWMWKGCILTCSYCEYCWSSNHSIAAPILDHSSQSKLDLALTYAYINCLCM